MGYVEGFVVPVPKKKLPAYRRLAQQSGKIWREYGALRFANAWPTTSRWGSSRPSRVA